MEIKIEKMSQFFISFFAMIITLISFILLSLQILFISLVWMLIGFLNRLNYKLNNFGVER